MELRSLGKYRLVSPLEDASATARGADSGTSCQLYLVRHEDEPNTDRPSYVAKLLQPPRTSIGGDADRRRAQFAHEVRLLEAVNHPSLPTLHAAGEQDGIPYIVMDRVDGVTLATLLGHHSGELRTLSKEIAVYVMGQLADAVRHLHSLEYLGDEGPRSLGVVHRNISPDNVMLSRSGDAVLVGFSKARSEWLDPAHDEVDAGQLAYTAPERLALDAAAGELTDVFGLAAMLWEMLKGARVLAGATDDETRENINGFDITQSSRRVSGVSPKLSEIVRKNLDRDPARRYDSAYQMLQRLAQSPEAQSAEQSRAELAKLVDAVAE